mmetsp:Transcript_34094/g.54567  ORF Transcript_34094/g.54567 Transcript_34094/m.54567 type:complete len:331 (+) Transcript_34094:767-1759(+)
MSAKVVKLLLAIAIGRTLYKMLRRRQKVRRLLKEKADGKVAVVTGAASGVGRKIAILMAKKGWHVEAIDINKVELDKLCQLCLDEGLSVRGHHVDITSKVDLDKLSTKLESNEVVAKQGIDCLVNCAAILLCGNCFGGGAEQTERLIAVNLVAPVNLTRQLLPMLLRGPNGGSVVNVSSIAGSIAWPWQGGYSITKFGMQAFSESLRREAACSGLNLRVALIQPGPIDTPMVANLGDKFSRWIEDNPNDAFLPGARKTLEKLALGDRFISSSNRWFFVDPSDIARAVYVAALDASPEPMRCVMAPGFWPLYYALRYLPHEIADALLKEHL